VSAFVDTSVWYAAADRGDRSNARAKEILAQLERPVTTDHVLVEAWLLLRHRIGRAVAERFWDTLRRGVMAVESVTSADLEVAWAIGQNFPDQDFSLVDRTSFAVMQRLGLERAAAFDDDFVVFRYGRRRDRAFTVLR
jgi:predicted nucleic acid-binding protein